MPEQRSRAWTFTLNNPDKYYDDVYSLLDFSFRYMVMQYERGEKKGTLHLQGYIYLYDAKTKTSMRKIMPHAHYELAMGNPEQNRTYCTKERDRVEDGGPYEFGQIPVNGRATWEKIEEAMRDPINNIQLFHQYRKTYQEIIYNTKKDHKRKLFVIPEKDQYKYARLSNGATCLIDDIDHYEGQDIVFVPCWTGQTRYIIPWIEGFPQKIRRGYQLVTFDPEVICITYSNVRERNDIIKSYEEYIDGLFEEGEIQEKQEIQTLSETETELATDDSSSSVDSDGSL